MTRAKGYEARDADPRIAVASLAILGGVVVLALALAGLAMAIFGRMDPIQASHDIPPPAPRLEVVGGGDLAGVRRVGTRRLGTYGWRDRGAGVAHIPIARAMQLQARRGWADAETRP